MKRKPQINLLLAVTCNCLQANRPIKDDWTGAGNEIGVYFKTMIQNKTWRWLSIKIKFKMTQDKSLKTLCCYYLSTPDATSCFPFSGCDSPNHKLQQSLLKKPSRAHTSVRKICSWFMCCSLSVISVNPPLNVHVYTSLLILFDSNTHTHTANMQTWARLLMCRKRRCVPVNPNPSFIWR